MMRKCDTCGVFKELKKVGDKMKCKECAYNAAMKKQVSECDSVHGGSYTY